MSLFKFIREKSKIFLSAAFIAALLSQMILPITSVQAESGPKFNFLDDPKTLRGGNRTAGQTDWQSSVTGHVGDEFRGIIYAHNGVLDTTAHNVTWKVFLPSQTSNGKFTVKATVSADNADTIGDTLNVTLDGDGDVQFIPGTVGWYPNIDGRADNLVTFPNGQSGDEIMTTGVNTGDIKGCWNYVQYVTFGFRVVPRGTFNLKIDKLVKDVTINESTFVDEDQAHPGDVLEYKISYANTGNAVAPAAVMTDVIPANTSYIAGTTLISKNGGAITNPGDTLGTDGLALGDLAPGDHGVVTFRVVTSKGLANNQVLVNAAQVSSDKISVEDTAKTIIAAGIIQPKPGKSLPITGASDVVISISATMLAGVAYMIYRRKKLAANVVTQVVDELLG